MLKKISDIGIVPVIKINDVEKAVPLAKALIDGGLPTKEGNSSFWAGDIMEIMKSQGKGTHGHIAIKTNSVDRAVYHLKSQGVEFEEDTATFNADGSMKFIYIKGEFGGFAVHLIQK